MLNHLDEIADAKNDVDAFKLSMVATGQFDHKKLFPEFFTETIEISDDTPDSGAQYDYTEVTWKSPSEAIDEYNKVMAALQNSSSGVVSGEQLSRRATWSDWK